MKIAEKDIVNYIKSTPDDFLLSFSDNTWSQPYIDEAAKMAIKEGPIRFLHNFLNKPWAQPYIDKAAKEFAKRHPKYFLEEWADRFPRYINFTLFAMGGKNVSR